MLLSCVISSNAQVIKITEKLQTDFGDEYIITIDNIEYRAINATHARDIAKRKVDLDTCNANLFDTKHLLALKDRDVINLENQLSNEKLISESWKRSYTLENQLRLKSETLQGRGRVSSFFDNPAIQILWKAAIPAISLYLDSKKK